MASIFPTTDQSGERLGWARIPLYAILLLGSVAMLLPFAWMLSASFKSLNEVLQVPPS